MSQLVRLEGKHSTQNAHCAVLGCISIQYPFLQIYFTEGNQVNISWKASCSWSRAKLVQAYLTCQSVCWLLQVSKAATAIDPGELLDSLG